MPQCASMAPYRLRQNRRDSSRDVDHVDVVFPMASATLGATVARASSTSSGVTS